jgi:hypothetical protein
MSNHENNPVTRAFAAYFRMCSREGFIPDQPANTSGIAEYTGKSYVVLHNVNGILAVYRILNNGALKALKRWPAALQEDWA